MHRDAKRRHDNKAFFAGASDWAGAGATFYVTAAGELTATSATVSRNGQLGRWQRRAERDRPRLTPIDANSYLKVDAASANALLRINNKGSYYSNGAYIDVDHVQYGLKIIHTGSDNAGGIQVLNTVGRTDEMGINLGYGVLVQTTRTADSTDIGGLTPFNALVTSAIADDQCYGLYAALNLSGTNQLTRGVYVDVNFIRDRADSAIPSTVKAGRLAIRTVRC